MGVKFQADYNFFQKWSAEMAYVLGFLYADGCVDYSPQIRGYYIRIGSTDREVVDYIKLVLKSEHKIYTIPRPGNKTFYLLQIGSRQMFDDLNRLGVVENKSNIITFPKVPRELLVDFVRGYFDGDGCAFVEKSATGSYKRLTTIFTSGSKEFLLQLQTVLSSEANLTITKIAIVRNNHDSTAYQLRYSSRNSLRLFYFLYRSNNTNFFLSRKKFIFNDYLKAKGINQENIIKILESKGPFRV